MIPAVLAVALASLAPADRPAAVAVSADGRRVVTLSADGSVRTFSAANGRELSHVAALESRGLAGPVLSTNGTAAALLPENSTRVEAGPTDDLADWRAIVERRTTAEAVGLSGDGEVVAAAFRLDSGITRLRTAKRAGPPPRPLAQVGGHVHALAVSQNGDWLLVLADEKPGEVSLLAHRPCQLFDVGTGQALWARDEPFRHALVTPDDKYAVLTGGPPERPNRVLDLADGEPARDRKSPPFAVVGPPTASPDGRTLYAATADAVVAWDLAAGREKFRLPVTGGETTTHRAAVSPDGRLLVTTFDGLRAWDAATGKPLWGPASPTMK